KHSTQRRHIRSRFEPDKCSTSSQDWAPWLQRLEANGQGICLFVFTQGNVYPCQISDRSRIPGVEFDCASQILSGFLPPPLPPIHLTESPKDLCVVRKFALSLNQFLTRPRIIQITPEKVIRLRQMRLAGIRLKANRSIYTALSQRQASFSAIVIKEKYLIVREG